MTMQNHIISCLAVCLALFATTAFGQTGKIAGTVTDAETGDPLPGVNVVIEGTTQGATSDTEGYYTILNVAPGTYSVRASFVGYASQVVEGVDVNIDLTATVDFEMQEEAVGLEEVVVQSQQPVVKPDISANVANIDVEQIQNIPVSSIEDVVGLQAGVEGLSIRGSGADEMAFMVDGMSMRDPRTNAPFTGISYTAVEEVQVQTGGFNAEYGNLRSGLVNVSTKEGPRDRYTFDAMYQYSPAARDYFGIAPDHENAYWMRPYLDPDVAFVGTQNGPWDRYMQRQYPEFEGYDKIAEDLNSTGEGLNLTPEQAQQVFEWEHRKDFSPTSDFVFDGSIGGPIPVVSDALGDLRFFGWYRQTKDGYIVPQRRDSYEDRTGQLKLTSNITSRIKLSVHGLISEQQGMNAGGTSMFTGGGGMASSLESTTSRDDLFALDTYSLMDIRRMQLGGEFTHTVSPRTFYTVKVQRNASNYRTGPGPERDTDVLETIGGMELNEAPFGLYNSDWNYSPVSGLLLGASWGTTRDSSDVVLWRVGSDVTSQLNRYSQLKAGFDLYYTDYNSAWGIYNPAQPSVSNPKFYWHRKTAQGAAYVQDKLEFEGMIANVGLRLDYFQPQGDWYTYAPYDRAFARNAIDGVAQEPIDGQFQLSPRLGVSFPVTTNSKLYFNYGHFRNIQQTDELFVVRTVFGESKIDRIGNPNLPMAKTVAYELGYEHNLFDQYLLRLTGYYKAQSDQPRDVTFHSIDGRVNYSRPLPFNYGDIRGVEVTVEKNLGRWIRGFANYTYMVEKSGNFGWADVWENRAEMREEIRDTRQHELEAPVPQPYARFNLTFLSPAETGPAVGAFHPLGNWRLSLLGTWRAGEVFTWDGGGNIEVVNNVRWRDYYMLDLRLTRDINLGIGDAQLFVDMNNVLNLRHMNRGSAFVGSFDFERYMQSLHLPEDTFEEFNDPYLFIPGDDHPGTFRDRDVEFVPIEVVSELPQEGFSRTQGHYGPLYYVKGTGQYHVWNAGSWQAADDGTVDQVLEDKAYIDMPNSQYFTFLNPRDVYFGLRITF